MMKKIVIVVFVCFLILPVTAQTFNIGPKAGLNYSRILIDQNFVSEGVEYKLATEDAVGTFTYGGLLRLNFGSFFIQPEVIWSQDKTELSLTSSNFSETQTYRINKLEVPLMAGFAIKKTLRLYGGPVATFIQKTELESPSEFFDEFSMNNDEIKWNLQTGIGFDISRFSIDFRYEGKPNRPLQSCHKRHRKAILLHKRRKAYWLH
jgi:hypothetical protein